MNEQAFDLASALADYLGRHPAEAASCALFSGFLATDGALFERSHPPGHFTGSAWLVSADGARVLLTHHRKLGRWLQLGGHADGDADLAQVALREAEEESGLVDLAVDHVAIDVDHVMHPHRRGGEEQRVHPLAFVHRHAWLADRE